MKEMLGNLADGQIEFYRSVSDFPCCLRPLVYIRARQWKSGIGLFRLFNAYAWTFSTFFVTHIPKFISNRAFLSDAYLYLHAVIKVS